MIETKPGYIRRIHALLPQSIKKDADLKAELVLQFTGDQARVSTKYLSDQEAKRLINYLIAQQPTNKMRKKILSMCHEMHWHKPGTTALDWERLEAWMLKYGQRKTKDLNAYNEQELRVLVTQLERVLESYYLKQKST